jgi:cysteine sulfinate desulfinase/cysteine desulfurase-like protein
VRFSLSRFTTGEEIDRVLDLLPRAAADIRDARHLAAAPIAVSG